MVLVPVVSDGNTCPPPILLREGLKVTTKVYLDILEKQVKTWLEAFYPEGNYRFQHDGAPPPCPKRLRPRFGELCELVRQGVLAAILPRSQHLGQSSGRGQQGSSQAFGSFEVHNQAGMEEDGYGVRQEDLPGL